MASDSKNQDIISNRDSAVSPATKQYASMWGMSENYIATLTVFGNSGLGEGNFSVSTSLDESFSISLGSTWNDPFANVVQEAMGNSGVAAAGNLIAQSSGISARSRAASAQVWQSTDPMEIQVPFTFVAQSDPKTEVQDKVKKLLTLVAPYQLNSFMLETPGPTILGHATNGGRKIMLRLGNFIQMEDCIIKRVDAQFDSIIGDSGIPHKAKVTVDIASFFTCYTVQDVEKMFVGG